MQYTNFEDKQDAARRFNVDIWRDLALELIGQISDDDCIDLVADMIIARDMTLEDIKCKIVRNRVNDELIKRLDRGGY